MEREKFILSLVNMLNEERCYDHHIWSEDDFEFITNLKFGAVTCYNCERCENRIHEYICNYYYIYIGYKEKTKVDCNNLDYTNVIDQLDEIRLSLDAINKHLGIMKST